jgi:hypothetical protein
MESSTPTEHEKAVSVLRESSEGASMALFSTGDSNRWWKWYEHEDDMRQLSSRFPDILFTLSGKGEENEDIWVKYFKGGRMQVSRATIAFEGFDEHKLS